MSTRCLIGAETEVGTRLVYVHSDGYPEGKWGKVETLTRLVARDGLSRVLSTLLGTSSGWSSFDGDPGEELSPGYRDGRFELVSGYGVRYTLTLIPGKDYAQGNETYATPADVGEWDWAYAYVFNPDGELRWGEYAATWDAIEWTVTVPA